MPRTKGFVASVNGLRSRVDAVYDVTLGYRGGVSTLIEFVRGKNPEVHIHVRRFPVATLPEESTDLTTWILDRFVEKDQRMEAFKANQRF